MPATKEEFKQAISELVRSDETHADGYVSGAKAHNFLRSRFPDTSYKDLGYEKLGSFFKEIASEGTISYDSTPPYDRLGPSGNPLPPRRSGSSNAGQGYLRPDIWAGFAFFNEPGPRYYVPTIDQFVLQPLTEGARFVEVPRPSETQQREWLLKFVENQDVTSLERIRQLCERPDWFHAIFSVGTPLSLALQSKWKRHRSELIVEQIRKWRTENQLDLEIFVKEQPPVPSKQPSTPLPSGHDAWRRVVLNALQAMPTHELMSLPIPPAYLAKFMPPMT